VLAKTSARVSLSLLVVTMFVAVGCTRNDDSTASVEPPAVPVDPPDPYEHSPSRFGVVPLHAGFSPDPRVVAGEAVGEVSARSIHRKCRGWISKTPDYLLDADTAFFQLYVLGRSGADVLLVVRKPDGSVLCNDNRQGNKDPMVRGDFPIGSTQVWVGVQDEGGSAAYRLGFSEVKWKPSSIPLPDPG
jgi:hypothetical protein